MHLTVYERSPKFRACWHVYTDVLAWCSLFDATHCNDWVSKL